MAALHPDSSNTSSSSLPAVAESPSLRHLSTRELLDSLQSYTRGNDTTPFTNWATTFRAQPQRVWYPTSVEGVRRIVELARRERVELRAVGSGHSPSDLCCTQGYMIDLKYMDKVIQVSPQGQIHFSFFLDPPSLLDCARSGASTCAANSCVHS